jgi:hypothetical protein
MRRNPTSVAFVPKGELKIPAKVSPFSIDSSRCPSAPTATSSVALFSPERSKVRSQARQFDATQAVRIDGVSLITGSQESPRSRLT